MANRTAKVLFALFLMLGIAVIALVAACENGDDAGDEGVTATDPPADTADQIDVSNVPELQDGVLTFGSHIANPPFTFYEEDTTNPDGLDIDIARALAQVLDVEAEFVNTAFEGLIPALESGDVDAAISAVEITDERSEVIDFIPYITVGSGIVVPAGNSEGIESLDGLCGKRVSVQGETLEVELLEDQNQACEEPIEIFVFDTNLLAVRDVLDGGSHANLSGFPTAVEDAANSGGALELVEGQIAPEPYGIGVRQTSPELNDALSRAFQVIVDRGAYAAILNEWGLTTLAIQ